MGHSPFVLGWGVMANIANCALDALRRPLAFALGLAVPVLTAALVLSGPGFASQIPDRLFDALAKQKVASLLQSTFGEEFSWQFVTHETRPASLAAWTSIGASIAALPASAGSDPRIELADTVRGPLASMVPIQLKIENVGRLDWNSFVVVTNVPDHAALSAGKPLGMGTWVVPARKAADLAIISYTLPAPRQRLIFDLLTADGRLLSSAQALLDLT